MCAPPAKPRKEAGTPDPRPASCFLFLSSFEVPDDAKREPKNRQYDDENGDFLKREHADDLTATRYAGKSSLPCSELTRTCVCMKKFCTQTLLNNQMKAQVMPSPDRKNYAMSHKTVQISSKRFAMSPWMPAYLKDDALLGVYARRFYALGTTRDAIEDYWTLRKGVALFDVPERPIEISGPDAQVLLERVLSRKIADLRQGRARYGIACRETGGIIMDGVVMKLEDDLFWFVLADGEFVPWLQAIGLGMDVTVRDPESWVLQIQGPKSLDVLADLLDEPLTDPFKYFSVHRTTIAGHPFLISRTGWTGELGFELYPWTPDFDGAAMFNEILNRGQRQGMVFCSLEAMGIRRIESGIMDNGTDMDTSMTPYEAGLGQFVDLDKDIDFIGKAALEKADKRSRFFGLRVPRAVPDSESIVVQGNRNVGIITSGGWSPYLDSGIAYVCFDEADDWPDRSVELMTAGGERHDAQVITLPFYDHEKRIPRGLETARL